MWESKLNYWCGFTKHFADQSSIAGLMDEIAFKVNWQSICHTILSNFSDDQVYDAMAYHVTQANFNHRVRAVSIWSLQMTVNAILSTLRNVVDPMSANLREYYAHGLPYEALASWKTVGSSGSMLIIKMYRRIWRRSFVGFKIHGYRWNWPEL